MKATPITPELQLLADQSCIINTGTGSVTSMEPRLTQILEILLSNRGKVVSREAMIEAIWGNYNSGQELLTHSISMLRKSVGKDLIVTIPKRGYMIHHSTSSNRLATMSLCVKYWWALAIAVIAVFRMIFLHH